MEKPHRTNGSHRVTSVPGRAHRRWLRISAGMTLVGAPLIVLVRTTDALLANHFLYPLLLVFAFAAGLAMVITGLRTRTPPRPGPMARIERWAGAIGIVAFAGALLWLQPAVATPRALEALASDADVTITDSHSRTVYEPASTAKAGFVLYPGAKVDPRAYAVIARGIAADGYRVVVPKCPLDIALLCENAAADIITADLPWAVGGHSLGGVAAASFASGVLPDGLVLLASFPLNDLSAKTSLDVVSISGTNDGLATPDDIASREQLLPPDTEYVPIAGAIHGHFGDYGAQRGDGIPATTRTSAQQRIITQTRAFLDSLARQRSN